MPSHPDPSRRARLRATPLPNNSCMRILRIAEIFNNRLGGMSRTMYGTGDELARRGHTVEYWFREDLYASGPPRQKLARFIIPYRVARMLRQAAAQGRTWDVVEIHEPIAAPAVWQRQNLPPIVVFSYGLEDRFHAAALAYLRLKGLPIGLKQRWSHRTISGPAGYAVRHAAHVICSNSEDIAHLRARGVPASRLTRHHSGVEAEFLDAGKDLPPYASRRGILFVGGWTIRKGILDLVPALITVLEKHRDQHATLAGGDVAAEIVQGLFPAALRDRVRVLPRVHSNAALIELYRSHALFVLPSYFEGQPLVMIEAAALGMPLVLTYVCGAKDFVRPGENGLTVPVGNPTALAESIHQILGDPALADRLGRAVQVSAQSHTWHAAASAIAAAYQAAIQTRHATGSTSG